MPTAKTVANVEAVAVLSTIKQKLASRKLWVAVITAAFAAMGKQLGIPANDLGNATHIVMAYLAAQGVHDAAMSVGSAKK